MFPTFRIITGDSVAKPSATTEKHIFPQFPITFLHFPSIPPTSLLKAIRLLLTVSPKLYAFPDTFWKALSGLIY